MLAFSLTDQQLDSLCGVRELNTVRKPQLQDRVNSQYALGIRNDTVFLKILTYVNGQGERLTPIRCVLNDNDNWKYVMPRYRIMTYSFTVVDVSEIDVDCDNPAAISWDAHELTTCKADAKRSHWQPKYEWILTPIPKRVDHGSYVDEIVQIDAPCAGIMKEDYVQWRDVMSRLQPCPNVVIDIIKEWCRCITYNNGKTDAVRKNLNWVKFPAGYKIFIDDVGNIMRMRGDGEEVPSFERVITQNLDSV